MAVAKLLVIKLFPQCSEIDCEKACQDFESSANNELSLTSSSVHAIQRSNAPGLAALTGRKDKKVTRSNPAPQDLELNGIQVVSVEVHATENEPIYV